MIISKDFSLCQSSFMQVFALVFSSHENEDTDQWRETQKE